MRVVRKPDLIVGLVLLLGLLAYSFHVERSGVGISARMAKADVPSESIEGGGGPGGTGGVGGTPGAADACGNDGVGSTGDSSGEGGDAGDGDGNGDF